MIPTHSNIPHGRLASVLIDIPSRPNRRRRRWAAIVISFLTGLLVGWLARGGGLP